MSRGRGEVPAESMNGTRGTMSLVASLRLNRASLSPLGMNFCTLSAGEGVQRGFVMEPQRHPVYERTARKEQVSEK